MRLKIITHERIVFEGEVEELTIQTTHGQMGILKDHIPVTTVLDIGVTKAKINGADHYFATMGGVFQFKDNVATILTDVARTDAILMLQEQMPQKIVQKQDLPTVPLKLTPKERKLLLLVRLQD